MPLLNLNEPGKEVLFMGNEAIARGALEAGVQVAAAYPGNPSSEIIASLAGVASEQGMYVEWSVNEKVALEIGAAAACSNMNALVAMKQNGLNVASDFLLNLNLTGIRGALVMVVADDPSGISSTNEEDSRIYAKLADIPLLEPCTFQEAKEMTVRAFDLSRRIGNVVMIRSVTRISHARGNVVLGPLPAVLPRPHFDTSKPFSPMPSSASHPVLHRRFSEAEEILSDSAFNFYEGPENPELTTITCGAGWFFAKEAVELLGLETKVGILKIGTTWPLPKELLLKTLKKTERVLFLEEVDPVLENNVASLYAFHNRQLPAIEFMGKNSGHIPSTGELSPELALRVLSKISDTPLPHQDSEYGIRAKEALVGYAPSRSLAFCAGCPHRSSFWAIKKALVLDGRDAVLFGDIGCYSLGIFSTGFFQLKTLHAMGSGTGMACGFGKFAELGVTQPSLAVCGDSTFFHAVVPGLINAVHSGSHLLLIVLDNSATAMTGFQPHPGSPVSAMGFPAVSIPIEDVCRAIGMETTIRDPFDLEETSRTIYELIQQQSGPKALVLRHECALVTARKSKPRFTLRVDSEKCIGENCGCDRLCTRVFKCPGLIWDKASATSKIDEAICAGCGVCADICPARAIIREEA
jgi:indolepyruvate ferredoxin oxidoreductase alpha subunit